MSRTVTVRNATKKDVIDAITSSLDAEFRELAGYRVQEINGTTRVRIAGGRDTIEVKEGRNGVKVDLSSVRPEVGNSLEKTLTDPGAMGSGSSNNQSNNTQAEEGTVHKPFNHSEARYHGPGEHSNDPCKTCAHYDNHGNCRIVEDIEPMGHCDGFYADVGVFGRDNNASVDVNMIILGDEYDWADREVQEFMDRAIERLSN